MSEATYNTLEWEMRKREENGEVETMSMLLAKFSDEQLAFTHDQLVDEHDAHRATKFMTGGHVDGSLRDYFAAVQSEMLTRVPSHVRMRQRKAERFETRRPVNVLRRASEFAADKQGTVSLSDLQNAYRLRR